MESNNVLILASNFPPYDGGKIGYSIRVFTMSDFLAREGYKVHIAIPARYYADRKPPTLHENIKLHKYFSPFQYFDHSKKLKLPFVLVRKFIFIVKKIVRKFLIDPNRLFSYFIANYLEIIIKRNNIKIVLSSSPPLTVSTFACILKKRLKDEILWIMDVRDISSLHPSLKGKDGKFISKLEKNEINMISNSDFSLVVSVGMKKYIESEYNRFGLDKNTTNKIKIVENGFVKVCECSPQSEIVDFYNKAKNQNRIVIIYAGTGVLYDRGNTTSKNKSLNNLVDLLVSDPILSKKFALIIQGVVKNSEHYFKTINTELMSLSMASVSNVQIRSNMNYADIGVNINIDKDYSPLILGGKIYDYCVSELALLLVFPDNAYSLKDFIQKHDNKPYFANVFDRELIRSVLMDIVDNPDRLKERRFTAEEMAPHLRENQYKVIKNIIDS